ncbi:AsnC family transcriptional regulator [Bordetella genomosp. 5]|uniref:AsnC family transcriptional regulator n=1 Tax=Bordetella genomosp. 5 TaxID=1395608 RepID=A0A261TT29_9BORD|nr:Lrp/AsnC family transcriptional regulator [Bordetella genomosp. 5]OZI43572.1 AsnC family transcriptional regulator [Bordetella genomosp. 5]OZI52816.1 AsnC family transcriptional regulator [Bordetella genomosp. 5]
MPSDLENENHILDGIDRRLVQALTDHARTSVADLARQVGMSAPSVADRLRRLEESGVIRRYTVDIDPAALGYGLTAIVRIRPLPGQLQRVERLITEIESFIECDKVTGDDCFVARLVLRSISELDAILERVTEFAETNTAIVKTSPIARRLPPLR